MGIQTDTHLVGQQYALLGTILYIGILVGEVGWVLPFHPVYSFRAFHSFLRLSASLPSHPHADRRAEQPSPHDPPS
jgi:hypothetical protein